MPNVKTNFTLSGEQEYRKKIGQINDGLKVLNSEMRLTQSRFADNADSVDALTAKNDVLERSILSQEEKVQTLRAALQESAEAYGESDKRTMKWQVSLNSAETELNRMNTELKKNQSAIEDQSESTEQAAESNQSLGDAVTAVADKLGIKLPSGATKAISALGSVSATTVAAASAVAAYIAILVKLEKAFIDVTIEAAAAADEMLTMSSISGMSVETLQEMQYAAEFVDVSVDRLNDGFKDLTAAMKSANTGSEDAQKAFAQLGVNITDSNGKLRDA